MLSIKDYLKPLPYEREGIFLSSKNALSLLADNSEQKPKETHDQTPDERIGAMVDELLKDFVSNIPRQFLTQNDIAMVTRYPMESDKDLMWLPIRGVYDTKDSSFRSEQLETVDPDLREQEFIISHYRLSDKPTNANFVQPVIDPNKVRQGLTETIEADIYIGRGCGSSRLLLEVYLSHRDALRLYRDHLICLAGEGLLDRIGDMSSTTLANLCDEAGTEDTGKSLFEEAFAHKDGITLLACSHLLLGTIFPQMNQIYENTYGKGIAIVRIGGLSYNLHAPSIVYIGGLHEDQQGPCVQLSSPPTTEKKGTIQLALWV